MCKSTDDNILTVKGFASLLEQTKASNRPIIPIIGAGLSADSGFPVLTSIVRYFGKLDQYIHRNAYLLPEAGELEKQKCLETAARGWNTGLMNEQETLHKIDREYKNDPWKYVRDFGWPDRFQLNQELYARLKVLGLQRDGKLIPADEMVACAARAGLDASLSRLNESGYENYTKLRKSVETILTADKRHRDRTGAQLERRIHALLVHLKPKTSPDRRTLGPDEQRILTAFKEIIDKCKNRFVENDEHKSVAFDVSGNWQKLIHYFTNYQSDYADSLFARFGAGRTPNRGHRFLAFLLKALDVEKVFTFNFDPMIEEVLISERLDPLIFAMEHGENLPHSALLQNRLSIIKMHGSTHSLLLDEQLDRPLSDEYLERFDRIAGQDPLLVVIGCSGGDNRLRDLVRHTLSRSYTQSHRSEVRVHWMHYEDAPPSFLKELDANARPLVSTQQTNNLGMTLMHLHALQAGVYPASHKMYLAHTDQPIRLGAIDPEEEKLLKEIEDRQIVMLCSLNLTAVENRAGPKDEPLETVIERYKKTPAAASPVLPATFAKCSASEHLLLLANRWARWGHQLIWVDLEDSYTLASVVGSIIDQCRKYDGELPPSVLPVDEEAEGLSARKKRKLHNNTLNLAVEKVTRALRRTRYFLAFDGLEAYVWPTSAHHGMTHGCAPYASARLAKLIGFLAKLTDPARVAELGESRVAIGVDEPRPRYKDSVRSPHTDCLEAQVAWLKRQWRNAPTPAAPESIRFSVWPKDAAHARRPVAFAQVFERPPIDARHAPMDEPALVRLKNVALEPLCAGPQDPVRFEQTIALLACFRRIRPLVLLQQVLEPLWGSREKVDDVLAAIHGAGKTGRMLRQLEGGGYLFRRALRDHVYGQNTCFTGADSLRLCLEGKPKPTQARWVAFQLLFTGLTHQQIARAWYSGTFVQSQDTFAFLEYTYHRLSSIRSFTKLLALTQKAIFRQTAGDPTLATAILNAIERCGDLVKAAASPSGQRTEFELPLEKDDELARLIQERVDGKSPGSELVKILEELKKSFETRHLQELQRFRHGWSRSEMLLRRQVPAQQLLLWCEQLIREDLVFRCNEAVIGYEDGFEENGNQEIKFERYDFAGERPGRAGQTVDRAVNKSGAEQEIRSFVEHLKELQTKIWIERSDYRAVEKFRKPPYETARDEIRDIQAQSVAKTEEQVKELLRRYASVLHQGLNVISSRLKSEQELTSSAKEMKKRAGRIKADLKLIRADLTAAQKLDKVGESEFAGDLHEAELRYHTLQAQCALRQVSVFSHNGFIGSNQEVKRWRACAKDAATSINQGLECIRGQDPHTLQSPRGVVVDPTSDGTFYLQYRAMFHLLRGRTQWMIGKQPADTGSYTDGCQDALRDFETARGGLGGHNNLIAALVDLYAAEACMARARVRIHSHTSKGKSPKDIQKFLMEADSDHNSARTFLQHARQLLLSSRRNSIWWKLFFRLITQYHSDRLLLAYTEALFEHKYPDLSRETLPWVSPASRSRFDHAERREEQARMFFNGFLIRLRKGYQSLRAACDYYPPRADEVPLRWIRRMWWEMSLCAYATGRLLLYEHRCNADKRSEAEKRANPFEDSPKQGFRDDKYIVKQLEWLNTSAGLCNGEPKQAHPLPPGLVGIIKQKQGDGTIVVQTDPDTIKHLEGFLHLGAVEARKPADLAKCFDFLHSTDPIAQRLHLINTARRRVEGEWSTDDAKKRQKSQRASKHSPPPHAAPRRPPKHCP